MSSNVKNRIQELNNRLADTLVEKGIDASGQETTTELIEKVGQFQPGGIPDGYIKPNGTLEIDKNGTYDVTEKAEVNVQVVAKPEKPYIDSSKLDSVMYFCYNGNNTDLSILKALDTSSAKYFKGMFELCTNLEEVVLLDTKNGIDFNSMFRNCSKLKTIPQFNTEKANSFWSMFFNCSMLTNIPLLNTSNVTIFQETFFNCKSLTTIPKFDTSNGEYFESMFNGCTSLIEVPPLNTSKGVPFIKMFYNCSSLKDIGGLDFGKGTRYTDAFFGCYGLENIRFMSINVVNNELSFSYCSKLTVESLLSILNALSDNSELDTTYTVHLGSANIAKLTDEQLLIAYSKNIALD